MILFDTSAFYALLDKNDNYHKKAITEWKRMLYKKGNFMTNSFVLLESIAVIQRRLGIEAVIKLEENILPYLYIDWLTESQYEDSLHSVISTNRRDLSLVDVSAFATMRRLGIRQVFTFDQHFAEQGFEVLP